MIRIAVTGPESSGKTTLAEALARHYGADLVGEYARTYLTALDKPYTFEDVEKIAHEQLRMEEAADGQLVICDTDILVLKIWFSHKFGIVPEWLAREIDPGRYTHHLLTRPDVPYEPDPLRENPGRGDYFFSLFKQELDNYEFPYTVIGGSLADRLTASKKAIDLLINGLS